MYLQCKFCELKNNIELQKRVRRDNSFSAMFQGPNQRGRTKTEGRGDAVHTAPEVVGGERTMWWRSSE